MKVLVVIIIISALSLSTAQNNFNVFKAYDKAKVRPSRYANTHTKYATSEYLSPSQQKMMSYRKGPDTPKVMWNDKTWLGFTNTPNQSLKSRKLEENNYFTGFYSSSKYYIIFGGIIFLLMGTLIAVRQAFILRIKGTNKSRNDYFHTKLMENDVEDGSCSVSSSMNDVVSQQQQHNDCECVLLGR